MTVNDLIYMIMKDVGAVSPGQPIEAAEVIDIRNILNVMVDSWNAEGFLLYSTTREDFTLTAAKATYDWGSTAAITNFQTARPVNILKAYIDDGGLDYPVDIIGEAEYDDITDKTDTGRPEKLFYNPTYPLGKVFLYFVPDSSYILHIDSYKDLIDFSTLTATINLPGEYMNALRWNGVIEACSYYSKPPTQLMMMKADETLRTLRRINAANKAEAVHLDLFTVPRATSGNIITGTN